MVCRAKLRSAPGTGEAASGSIGTTRGSASSPSASASTSRTGAPVGSWPHHARIAARRSNTGLRAVRPSEPSNWSVVAASTSPLGGTTVVRPRTWCRSAGSNSSSCALARHRPARVTGSTPGCFAGRVAKVASCAALGPDGAVRGELGLDLLAPAGEPAQHRPRDPVDLGGAVRVQHPGQAERGELVAQRRLVQGAGGLGLQVQLPPVQRRPAPVRPAGHVRHQHVGVQLRVPGPRRAVPERRGDEPTAGQPVPAVLAAADLPGLPLQIPQSLPYRRVVRPAHRGRRRLIPQREQQRHRLRCGERQVQPWQPVRATHPQQRPPRGRIPADQHRPQTLRRHPADQTQPRRPRPHPPTRRLTRPQVVVLHPRRNRPQVVPLRAPGELADAQHHGHLTSDTGTADVVAGHAYPPSQSARDGPRGTAAPDATAACVR